MNDEHNEECFRDFSPSSGIEEVDDNLFQVDDVDDDDYDYDADDDQQQEEEEEEDDTLLLNEGADYQASILDDVANYIKSLKLQIEVLEETAKANPLNMKMEPNTPVISHVLRLKINIDIYRSFMGPSQWDRPAMQAYCLMYTLPDIEPWIWFKTQCYQELINFRPLELTWNFYDTVQWPRCFASMALSCSEFEYYYVHCPSDTRFPTNNPVSRDSGTTTQLGD